MANHRVTMRMRKPKRGKTGCPPRLVLRLVLRMLLEKLKKITALPFQSRYTAVQRPPNRLYKASLVVTIRLWSESPEDEYIR
ncbi:hypothetical protein E4U43_001412 [Claviceps pusilla]|uniref:Uncharacterized protein n=1 Tax=Claviceps pusilla TaxID=123648 RepID=A0A9P7NA70_9HYPO|nr:hypothetical protein E4U43_001412 [Claviceps pusilla]